MTDRSGMWGSRRTLLAALLGLLLSAGFPAADAHAAPGAALPAASQVRPGQDPPAAAPQPVLMVLGASSMTDALTAVSRAYTRQTRQIVKLSFAASSALARQIEAGAPADVFVSADEDWMNYLQSHKLIDTDTRHNVLSNSLVLIAPLDSRIKLRVAPGFPLAAALGSGRLATGNPDSVPVGKYAKAALTRLGVWTQVENKVAAADNVRAALAYVARGETPLGIVYRTDALIEKKVKIIAQFPDSSHDPIIYPAAATVSAHDGARGFVRFLRSSAAQAIFHEYGFGPAP